MDGLIEAASGYVVDALTVVLVALATMIAGWFKLKIDEAMKERIRQGAVMAVGYAEEQGRQYLQTTGVKLPGVESSRIAVERLMATVPRVSAEEARIVVESVLPFAREAMAVGAAELGKAIRTPESLEQLKSLEEQVTFTGSRS